MKKVIILTNLILILLAINLMIIRKEETLKNGQTVLLKLRPVDPRSLMQGDYMTLRYEIADMAEKEAGGYEKLPSTGYIVISLDSNSVGTFKRFYNGENPGSDELILFFRNRRGLRFGAETFFFQEGKSKLFEKAGYGELKVDSKGQSLLTGLRDQEKKLLGGLFYQD